MMDKRILRKEKLKCRSSLPADVRRLRSEDIIRRLAAQPEVEGADAILCYVNYKSEVETISFIEMCLKKGKKVFCPKVLSETEMEFYEISSPADLKRGTLDIPEPDGNAEKAYRQKEGGCIILPGAAFDRMGNRIGYGKGYYDRYLRKHPGFRTIGLCFSCQMADLIRAEATDIKVDKIITENEVYEIV